MDGGNYVLHIYIFFWKIMISIFIRKNLH